LGVRKGVEAWYDSGVNTLIVVPSSARGNQMVALEQDRGVSKKLVSLAIESFAH
jgi:hypothetical protein